LAAGLVLAAGCGAGRRNTGQNPGDVALLDRLASGETTVSDVGLTDGRAELPRDSAGDSGPDVPPREVVADYGSEAPQDTGHDLVPDCTVKDPLTPFMFGFAGALSGGDGGPGSTQVDVDSVALVSMVTRWGGDFNWDWEIHLALEGVKDEAILLMTLPLGYRIPVAAGQKIYLRVVRDSPWWTNSWVAVWDEGKALRFFLVDGDGGTYWPPANCKAGPCPRIELVETGCPAQPVSCGEQVVPDLRFSGAWGTKHFDLAQGEILQSGTVPGTLKFFGVSAYLNTTMTCDDHPDNWVAGLFLDNSSVSQCNCIEGSDCSTQAVCETQNSRCVANGCLGKNCEEWEWCDPYGGECFPPPPSPLLACESSADCPTGDQGCGMVCNTYLGYCQNAICCVADCMGYCSDLFSNCAECLGDCDCEPFGKCDQLEHKCLTCDESRIGLTKKNNEAYEFYELCIPKGFEAVEAVLKQVDPSLYCGVAGGFAKCSADEIGCHGELEYPGGGSKVISQSKWSQLCSLSMLQYVTKISGGHFI